MIYLDSNERKQWDRLNLDLGDIKNYFPSKELKHLPLHPSKHRMFSVLSVCLYAHSVRTWWVVALRLLARYCFNIRDCNTQYVSIPLHTGKLWGLKWTIIVNMELHYIRLEHLFYMDIKVLNFFITEPFP